MLTAHPSAGSGVGGRACGGEHRGQGGRGEGGWGGAHVPTAWLMPPTTGTAPGAGPAQWGISSVCNISTGLCAKWALECGGENYSAAYDWLVLQALASNRRRSVGSLSFLPCLAHAGYQSTPPAYPIPPAQGPQGARQRGHRGGRAAGDPLRHSGSSYTLNSTRSCAGSCAGPTDVMGSRLCVQDTLSGARGAQQWLCGGSRAEGAKVLQQVLGTELLLQRGCASSVGAGAAGHWQASTSRVWLPAAW
jgi:hypothetical protein